MSDIRTNKPTRQQGYSLAEVLVATAIFTIIFVAALMIYDRSNKVFKQGVESSDMQQSTRVAFDQLASDVRMTGFDFDRDGRPFGLLGVELWLPDTDYQLGNVVQPDPPNGHAYVVITSGKSDGSAPSWPVGSGETVDETSGLKWKEKQVLQYQQPDEQLEFMGATAITLRGNLDYESDAAHDNGREENLESDYFPVVTTANDEIVTYALKSQDSSKNTGEIVFYADTFTPRKVHPAEGEAEEEIKITGVDLSNANPPYTLYRYTLKADGTPEGGTPLADNIRSLNFTYFRDTAGTVQVAPNGGAGQFDGANPAETVERQARREIRAIGVDLVGMNPQPDGDYTNPEDTVMPHHRQYRLESMIVPRNLGRRGMKELSVDAPGKPTIKVACMGSCNVAYVTWEPPSKGEVITYNVMYDVDAIGGYNLEDVGNTLEAYVGKYLVPNTTTYFKVQAINPNGFATSDNTLSILNINRTTPAAPTSGVATHPDDPDNPAQANQIMVSWPRATQNVAPANILTCSDGSTRTQETIPGNEKIYYRLYKSTDENFTPAPANKVFDENSTLQPTFSGSNLVFTDTAAANCKDYFYRIQTVDACVANANYNDPARHGDRDQRLLSSGRSALDAERTGHEQRRAGKGRERLRPLRLVRRQQQRELRRQAQVDAGDDGRGHSRGDYLRGYLQTQDRKGGSFHPGKLDRRDPRHGLRRSHGMDALGLEPHGVLQVRRRGDAVRNFRAAFRLALLAVRILGHGRDRRALQFRWGRHGRRALHHQLAGEPHRDGERARLEDRGMVGGRRDAIGSTGVRNDHVGDVRDPGSSGRSANGDLHQHDARLVGLRQAHHHMGGGSGSASLPVREHHDEPRERDRDPVAREYLDRSQPHAQEDPRAMEQGRDSDPDAGGPPVRPRQRVQRDADQPDVVCADLGRGVDGSHRLDDDDRPDGIPDRVRVRHGREEDPDRQSGEVGVHPVSGPAGGRDRLRLHPAGHRPDDLHDSVTR